MVISENIIRKLTEKLEPINENNHAVCFMLDENKVRSIFPGFSAKTHIVSSQTGLHPENWTTFTQRTTLHIP